MLFDCARVNLNREGDRHYPFFLHSFIIYFGFVCVCSQAHVNRGRGQLIWEPVLYHVSFRDHKLRSSAGLSADPSQRPHIHFLGCFCFLSQDLTTMSSLAQNSVDQTGFELKTDLPSSASFLHLLPCLALIHFIIKFPNILLTKASIKYYIFSQ